LRFNIQVASFSEKERAFKAIREFEGKGLDFRIEEVFLKNRVWYPIIGGPYLITTAKKTKKHIALISFFV